MPESLIFIPDISGFTEFVNNTEISHSQHIISELLELLIKTDDLNLDVAEIEGDAILFIKEESVPSIGDLMGQAERMFLQFHRHLKQYESDRICNCGACSTASGLSLKIIAHASELSFTTINQIRKPFGPGLITAHRLLKNSIPEHEYLLFSDNFANEIKSSDFNSKSWVNFNNGVTEYKDLGKVNYHFILMNELKENIDQVEPIQIVPQDTDPLTFEGVIKQSADMVFEVISNLDYRLFWSNGIKELKYDRNKVNRAGMKHVCVFSGSQVEIETIKSNSREDELIYGERINDAPVVKDIATYFILKNQNGSTLVKVKIYFNPPNFLGRLLLPLIKMNTKRIFRNSFEMLKDYCEKDTEIINLSGN
jgi:hypothetical protein